MPLASVPARHGELPIDRPVDVIRATGIDADPVAGGPQSRSRMGRPVVTGPHRDAA